MPSQGLQFITTASVSGASSVNIDNCFSATYHHYLVRWNLTGSAADRNLRIQMRSGGSTDTGTNYRRQNLRGNSTTVDAQRNTGQAFFATIGYSTTDGSSWQDVMIFNPYDAVRTTVLDMAATSDPVLEYLAQAHDLTSSYDGITFFVDFGTLTGNISVWGYTIS